MQVVIVGAASDTSRRGDKIAFTTATTILQRLRPILKEGCEPSMYEQDHVG
jgi:hypothetical protein